MTERPKKKPQVDAHLSFNSHGVWVVYVCDWELADDAAGGWKPVFHNALTLEPKPNPVPTRRQRAEALAAIGWELIDSGNDPWKWNEVQQSADASPLIYACTEVRPIPGWEAPPD